MLSEYLWIFVVAVFLAIFVAWGIGANDVVSVLVLFKVVCNFDNSTSAFTSVSRSQANSFGSSVGTKALTMGQVCTHADLTSSTLRASPVCLADAAVAQAAVTSILKLLAFEGPFGR